MEREGLLERVPGTEVTTGRCSGWPLYDDGDGGAGGAAGSDRAKPEASRADGDPGGSADGDEVINVEQINGRTWCATPTGRAAAPSLPCGERQRVAGGVRAAAEIERIPARPLPRFTDRNEIVSPALLRADLAATREARYAQAIGEIAEEGLHGIAASARRRRHSNRGGERVWPVVPGRARSPQGVWGAGDRRRRPDLEPAWVFQRQRR